MKREVKFLVLFFTVPMIFAFVVVLAYTLLGIEHDAVRLFDRSAGYASGTIFGWWMWGAR